MEENQMKMSLLYDEPRLRVYSGKGIYQGEVAYKYYEYLLRLIKREAWGKVWQVMIKFNFKKEVRL